MKIRKYFSLRLLLLLATVCVFAGRAWQHLFWDAPFREFFWDPTFMSWWVTSFTNFSWEEYVTSPIVDDWIQRIIFLNGVFFSICFLVTSLIFKVSGKWRITLWLGSINLFVLALMYVKENFFHVGQLFEYALQFSSPLFLYFFMKEYKLRPGLLLFMKIAVSATFVSHGLYAIGYYPRPGSFYEMTMNSLWLSQDAAHHFLNVVGWLDMLVGIGVFLPWRFAKIILAYAAFWGLCTSLARITGNFYWQFPLESLHQWLYQAVYRFPHFIIPLVLYHYYSGVNKTYEVD